MIIESWLPLILEVPRRPPNSHLFLHTNSIWKTRGGVSRARFCSDMLESLSYNSVGKDAALWTGTTFRFEGCLSASIRVYKYCVSIKRQQWHFHTHTNISLSLSCRCICGIYYCLALPTGDCPQPFSSRIKTSLTFQQTDLVEDLLISSSAKSISLIVPFHQRPLRLRHASAHGNSPWTNLVLSTRTVCPDSQTARRVTRARPAG